MIGLMAILQKKTLTQVSVADAIGVSKQSFSKYLKCLQRIPENKVILLENILEVPRQYFVDGYNYCITLDTDQLYELYKIIENTDTERKVFKVDGRKQKFSSKTKTERELLLHNLKTMKPFQLLEPQGKKALSEMECINAEFCNRILKLRSELDLTQEQWDNILLQIKETKGEIQNEII